MAEGVGAARRSAARAGLALALVAATALGCGRGGAAAIDENPPSKHGSDTSPAPVGVPVGAAEVPVPAGASPTQGMGDPRERRVRPPAVIGGCGLGCSTPEAAVSLLLAQLQSQDRVAALRPLFEWSLLQVDGEALGAGWAALWADPNQHGLRQQQIDQWLGRWSGWVERQSDPQGWATMRKRGIRLRTIDAATAEVWLRHPPLRQDETAPLWRLELRLRGAEWLVAAIDHRPAQP